MIKYRFFLLSIIYVIFLIMISISSVSAFASDDYIYKDYYCPNCVSNPCDADQWGFYIKNCTSYVAWRMNRDGGEGTFSNYMNGGHWGNAYNWDDNAYILEIPVNTTPSVGAIAHWGSEEIGGGYGHVAYVEKVNDDGSVDLSEYNYGNPCAYGERQNIRAPRYIHVNINNQQGWVSVSNGVNVSPYPVLLGENFTINFTLKETTGAPKTFEQVAIAILRADNSLLFDFAMYDAVTIAANGTWSQSATNQIWDTNPPGTYKAIIRGKIDGQWFDFDTIDSGVNPRSFTAVEQIVEGYASVSQGVTVTPSPVVLGQDFTINFTLKEVNGVEKTFEQVAVSIIHEDNSLLFDFAIYDNVSLPANGTWSASPTNVFYDTNPTGMYKAVIRGRISGGDWFDFDVTGDGVNPKNFFAILPDQDDNYEENDSISTAFDLSNHEGTWLQNIDGIAIQADDDWYKIYVNPGDERVHIDIRFTHYEGDIDVALYDELGNILTRSNGVVDNEYIDYVVPASGVYFIRVYYENAGNSYNLWWDDFYILRGDYDSDNDVDGLDLSNLVLDLMEGFADEHDVLDFTNNYGTH